MTYELPTNAHDVRTALLLVIGSVFFVGCGKTITLPQVARATFAETYGCPQAQVITAGGGFSEPVAAQGCGHAAEYTCYMAPIGAPAKKSSGDWRCDPAEDFAVASVAQAWSCPWARISVKPAEPAQPPPDVANDSERLGMWQRTPHPRIFSASGCGKSARVSCRYVTMTMDTGVVGGSSIVQWTCTPGPDVVAPATPTE